MIEIMQDVCLHCPFLWNYALLIISLLPISLVNCKEEPELLD